MPPEETRTIMARTNTATKPAGYDADFRPIAELMDEAYALGAQSIRAAGIGWESPREGKPAAYEASCEITRADGVVITMPGFAEPGDAQVPDAPAIEDDVFVRDRARKRAISACIRAAWPHHSGPRQSPEQKRLQAAMREYGEHVPGGRDTVRDEVCRIFGVQSSKELLPIECHVISRAIERKVAALEGKRR